MSVLLFNPKDTRVEFMCDRQIYIFEPGEKQLVEDFVANNALHLTNTGLKVCEPEDEVKAKTIEDIGYETMPWKQLVSMASARGLFKPGTLRATLIENLKEEDARARTV
jgi:hypothetical protein